MGKGAHAKYSEELLQKAKAEEKRDPLGWHLEFRAPSDEFTRGDHRITCQV
jgi:hypothetical protein